MRLAGAGASTGQQLLALKKRYPGGFLKHRCDSLVWRCGLVPMAGCEQYNVRLAWKKGHIPEVWVDGGALSRCKDLASVPHKFGFDETKRGVHICLLKREWNQGMLLADTYVPWTMEWLVDFELWLATGEWLGGGEHPA